MLIISIPKSASSSLLHTFGQLHHTPSKQIPLPHRLKAKNFPLLGKYHPDAKELVQQDVKMFDTQNEVYKQHILPTKNNLELLEGVKKVILLKKPEDVVLAYHRAELKRIHKKPKEEFHGKLTGKAWLAEARKNGLLKELEHFYKRWQQKEDKNTLLIYFDDLVKNPKSTINRIEEFWKLPITHRPIELSKKRYSRYTLLKTPKQYIRKQLIISEIYEKAKEMEKYIHRIKNLL